MVVMPVTCLVKTTWVLFLPLSTRLVLEDTLPGVVVEASFRLVGVGMEVSVFVEVEEGNVVATSWNSVEVFSVFSACIARRFG